MTYEEFARKNPNPYHSDVRWGELDSLQHVNNTVFFRYFECARMFFWEDLERNTKGKFPPKTGPILASTSCRFRRQLLYPDKIAIGVRISTIGEDRFTVIHTVWSESQQEIVAEGDAVIVSYDYEAQKKVPLPAAWKEFMELKLRSQES